MNSKESILIKVGGSLLDSEEAMTQTLIAIAEVASHGNQRMVLVHGGGKEISRNLEFLGEKPKTVDGLRITPPAAMDMVEMTLSGLMNKRIVRTLNRSLKGSPVKALGISGVDGNLFFCVPHSHELQRVGRIDKVDVTWVKNIWDHQGLPVVSPVSVSHDFQTYNVNADEAAGALATELKVKRLLFLSDVEGVYDQHKNIIPQLRGERAQELISQGVIAGGMIPKVKSCLNCLESGVQEVHICGLIDKKSLIEQITGKNNSGTIFISE